MKTPVLPKKMNASSGGYLGRSWELELKGDKLHIRIFLGGYSCFDRFRKESYTPSEEQWNEFQKSLDEINIWAWQKEYQDKHLIVDGGGWDINIAWGKKRLKSCGSNTYPGKNGVPYFVGDNDDDYDNTDWARFNIAINRLTEGRLERILLRFNCPSCGIGLGDDIYDFAEDDPIVICPKCNYEFDRNEVNPMEVGELSDDDTKLNLTAEKIFGTPLQVRRV